MGTVSYGGVSQLSRAMRCYMGLHHFIAEEGEGNRIIRGKTKCH